MTFLGCKISELQETFLISVEISETEKSGKREGKDRRSVYTTLR